MDGPARYQPVLEAPGRNALGAVVTGSAALLTGAVVLALSKPGTAAGAVFLLAVLMLLALRSGSSHQWMQ